MFSLCPRHRLAIVPFSITMITITLSVFTVSADTVILADLSDDAQNGNTTKLVEHCGSMLSGDADPESLAKAYTMLAIAYTLQDASDTRDKCAGLLDLLPDLLASPAVPLITFLTGKSTKAAMRSEMKEQPDDWKTTAALCELIVDIKSGDLAQIKNSHKNYKESVRLVRATDWSAAWSERSEIWSAWLRSGKGNPKTLERLIAKRKGTSSHSVVASGNDVDTLQRILTLYLDGKIADANKLASEKRDGTPKTSPLHPVLDYLAGNKSISAESLFKATSKDAGLWALASLAMFTEEITSNDKPDKNNLLYHLKNFAANVKAAGNDPRLASWRKEVPKWRKWCENGFKSAPDLPILLRARSVDGDAKLAPSAATNPKFDITTISLEDFIATRAPYAKRPKLVGLQCSRQILQRYFDTLPKELKRSELRRYKTIKSVKEYIIRILERNPYPNGLILKRRRKTIRISGIVTMANEKYLIYRKSNKSKRCYWKDLSYKQYAAFMKYYAGQRLKLKGGVGKLKRSEILADASDDYLGLAMLYDWHKKYKSALYYARKAIQLNKKNKNAISAAMVP